nr:ORF17 [Acipenserid herpesvirus 1]
MTTASAAVNAGHFCPDKIILTRTFDRFNPTTLFNNKETMTLEETCAKIVMKTLLNTKNYYEPEYKKIKIKTIIKGRGVFKHKKTEYHKTIKSSLKEVFWLKMCANRNVVEVVDLAISFNSAPYQSRWYESDGRQLTKRTPNLPRVLNGVLSALAYIHDVIKLYHRNIQASSVVVVNGEAKLKNFEEASTFPWTRRCYAEPITQAPELLAHTTQLPAKVDIWSFGMMVWKLYGPTCFKDNCWYDYQTIKEKLNFFFGEAGGTLYTKHLHINDLLAKIVQLDPTQRSTIAELLELEFFNTNE